MHWLWVLIVGAIIGAIAGAITSKGQSMGWLSNIIAGLIGSSLGEALLGSWGPQLAGMAIVPTKDFYVLFCFQRQLSAAF